MSFQKTELANGVRILTESVGHVGSASVGVWCRTGSSDETEKEAGITHFIEHMLFKGTGKRTSKQIAEEIEGRGGVLNAFTDKEQTCYYCHVLAEDAPVGLEVLSDMITGSTLDPKELETEKGVVLEEIKRGEDEPGDSVHDKHMQGLWPDHILGKPIIGTSESVSAFTRDDLSDYLARRYTGGTVLVSVAGNVKHDAVVECVQETLGGLAKGDDMVDQIRPEHAPGVNEIAQDVQQVHFCIGTEGVSFYDDDFYTLVVADSILGGGMSSRLFQEVREKRGLAYSVGSYMASYRPGGAFTVYGGTGKQTWAEVQTVVREELDKIADLGPDEEELERTKRQISGNIVLGLEGMGARMRRQAKNEFVFGRQIPISETVEKIRAVSTDDIRRVCKHLFDPAKMRTTAIGPFA